MDDRGGRAGRNPVPLIGLVLFGLATVVAALLVIKLIGQGDDGPVEEVAVARPEQEPEERPRPEPPPAVTSAQIAEAVDTARRNSTLGDSRSDLSVVVWGRGQKEPAEYQGGSVERLWSLSKPVIALAALRQGADDGSDGRLVQEAILRSSNCAARSLVLGLESERGSAPSPRQGVGEVEQVLADAGITLTQGPQVAVPEDDGCAANGYPELENPEGAALPLFGTAEWTGIDAARFMRALGDLGYGQAGEELLELMSDPKAANEDPGASCDPGRPEPGKWEWGIGQVFSEWDPAYKSAWGGGPQESGPVMFSQMGLVERGDDDYALAVSLRVPDHLGGEPGSQCVTIEEIELVEEVLQQVEPLLAGDKGTRQR